MNSALPSLTANPSKILGKIPLQDLATTTEYEIPHEDSGDIRKDTIAGSTPAT